MISKVIQMTSAKIESMFFEHIARSRKVINQFRYNKVRYVQCERCKRVVPTEDCMYYGGAGYKMLFGGCRNCYGRR